MYRTKIEWRSALIFDVRFGDLQVEPDANMQRFVYVTVAKMCTKTPISFGCGGVAQEVVTGHLCEQQCDDKLSLLY